MPVHLEIYPWKSTCPQECWWCWLASSNNNHATPEKIDDNVLHSFKKFQKNIIKNDLYYTLSYLQPLKWKVLTPIHDSFDWKRIKAVWFWFWVLEDSHIQEQQNVIWWVIQKTSILLNRAFNSESILNSVQVDFIHHDPLLSNEYQKFIKDFFNEYKVFLEKKNIDNFSLYIGSNSVKKWSLEWKWNSFKEQKRNFELFMRKQQKTNSQSNILEWIHRKYISQKDTDVWSFRVWEKNDSHCSIGQRIISRNSFSIGLDAQFEESKKYIEAKKNTEKNTDCISIHPHWVMVWHNSRNVHNYFQRMSHEKFRKALAKKSNQGSFWKIIINSLEKSLNDYKKWIIDDEQMNISQIWRKR